MNQLDDPEKSKSHIITEIIDYVPNAVVSKVIIKKTTGNVTATSIASGEEMSEKSIPFDTYVQIIDGTAEVVIDNIATTLKVGSGIIIPAHSRHSFTANGKYKMITTIIKSGYDE